MSEPRKLSQITAEELRWIEQTSAETGIPAWKLLVLDLYGSVEPEDLLTHREYQAMVAHLGRAQATKRRARDREAAEACHLTPAEKVRARRIYEAIVNFKEERDE